MPRPVWERGGEKRPNQIAKVFGCSDQIYRQDPAQQFFVFDRNIWLELNVEVASFFFESQFRFKIAK